jgi:hypothetical protein
MTKIDYDVMGSDEMKVYWMKLPRWLRFWVLTPVLMLAAAGIGIILVPIAIPFLAMVIIISEIIEAWESYK